MKHEIKHDGTGTGTDTAIAHKKNSSSLATLSRGFRSVWARGGVAVAAALDFADARRPVSGAGVGAFSATEGADAPEDDAPPAAADCAAVAAACFFLRITQPSFFSSIKTQSVR